MMTKVGQLSEEEKLAYAKEESERTKKEMAATMLQKGYPIREIADIIQGLSLDEILALKKHKTAVMCKKRRGFCHGTFLLLFFFYTTSFRYIPVNGMIFFSSSSIRSVISTPGVFRSSSGVFTPNIRSVSARIGKIPSLFSGFASISMIPENSVPVSTRQRLFSSIRGSVTVKHTPVR